MQNGQQQANAPAWTLFGLLAQPLPGIANKSASALHQVEGKKKKKENDIPQGTCLRWKKKQVQVPAPNQAE